MLDNDMIEFLTYRNAMKSNYRKGVHALRCILNNRKQAETFAGSLGGVSVVLGVSQPDGNSEALRALLEGSAVIDQATLTWLKNWWPEQCGSWDTLAADQGRCNAIATDPFLWERVGVSPVGAGKILAGLVGQDSRNFAAMQAVASSATAMQAVASSATARSAIAGSSAAREELKKSPLIVEKTGIIPSGSTYWNSTGITLTSIKGVLIATSAGNSDNALTILAIDDATLTTDEQTRNAAPKNSSGYLSWIDSQPNYLWVRQKIRMAAYYTSTKVKYIPC